MQLRKPQPASKRVPRGITLLELLLALGLTGVIMVVISIAIDLHLRTFNTRRANVEESQLARALLRHIAKDLRSTVWYEPIDLTGVQQISVTEEVAELLESVDGAGGALEDGGDSAPGGDTGRDDTGRDDTGGGDTGGDTGGGDMGDDTGMLDDGGLLGDMGLDMGVTENNVDIAGAIEPTSVPGLFGNQFELRVDVSYLPRADQYDMSAMNPADTGGVRDMTSDVKSVSYFLQTSDEADPAAMLSGSAISGIAGLARRQQDRAVTAWASDSGGLEAADHSGALLAPEVNYLEFRYFDGLDWYTEWDSEQMEGLPVAVEITIGMDPAGGVDPGTLDVGEQTDLAMEDTEEHKYRMVVHLPVAKPAELEEMSEMDLMGDLGI